MSDKISCRQTEVTEANVFSNYADMEKWKKPKGNLQSGIHF